ncbi:hypothetical protein FQR65_LT20971 [Abscondita terminalis]|nr:hypothetical protein FQR65_LT20971 [Abscondita terminalis]
MPALRQVISRAGDHASDSTDADRAKPFPALAKRPGAGQKGELPDGSQRQQRPRDEAQKIRMRAHSHPFGAQPAHLAVDIVGTGRIQSGGHPDAGSGQPNWTVHRGHRLHKNSHPGHSEALNPRPPSIDVPPITTAAINLQFSMPACQHSAQARPTRSQSPCRENEACAISPRTPAGDGQHGVYLTNSVDSVRPSPLLCVVPPRSCARQP